MTNNDLMRLLAEININDQQKKAIYIIVGLGLIAVFTSLYYSSKNKELTFSLNAEKQESDRLNYKLIDANKNLSRQQKEIQKLKSENAQLQKQMKEENKSS